MLKLNASYDASQTHLIKFKLVFWIPTFLLCMWCMHWCFVLLKLLTAIQKTVVMIWRVIMYCFVFFCYRAAWWIQGRPRTRLWCQRRQEPRSNLLKTHTVHIAHWTASHQDLKIFSAPRWTICHLLFLFFFFFLLVSAPFSLSQLTHHDLFCFLEGSGVWFLVFRVSLKGLRLFNIYSQCSSWPSGSSSKSIWIFFFLWLKKYCSVCFCGTKDCQVVTDKYFFCWIVVGKDKDPLVLRYVDECITFYLLFNLGFFFIRA